MQRIEPYSPEWYEQRLGKFTSSEFWKLLGTPKGNKAWTDTAETYIIEKVAELVTGQCKPSIDNDATRWGHHYEPEALDLVAKETGIKFEGSELLIHDESFCGTPDETYGTGIVEVKCPFNTTNHIQNLLIRNNEDLKQAHVDYYFQIQCNMILARKEEALFVSYDPRVAYPLSLHIVYVQANFAHWDLIMEQLKLARTYRDERLMKIYELQLEKTTIA